MARSLIRRSTVDQAQQREMKHFISNGGAVGGEDGRLSSSFPHIVSKDQPQSRQGAIVRETIPLNLGAHIHNYTANFECNAIKMMIWTKVSALEILPAWKFFALIFKPVYTVETNPERAHVIVACNLESLKTTTDTTSKLNFHTYMYFLQSIKANRCSLKNKWIKLKYLYITKQLS